MAYEVEQRAKISSGKEFNRIKKFLDENAKFFEYKEMKSFLFRKPYYLRIRLVKGKNDAIITIKSGSYEDKARKETEFILSLSELNNFINQKKKEGFNECALIHTKRFSYKFMRLNVELNEIDSLGLIVEAEGITEQKNEIDKINKKIDEIFKILKIKKLKPQIYQKMMDKMYQDYIKNINNLNFFF